MDFGGDLQAKLDFYKLNVPARVPLAVEDEELWLNKWKIDHIIQDLQPFRNNLETDNTTQPVQASNKNSEEDIVYVSRELNDNEDNKKEINQVQKLEITTITPLMSNLIKPAERKTQNIEELYQIPETSKNLLTFTCEKCGEKFIEEDLLEKHLSNSDTCSKPKLCFLCPFTADNNSTLKLHVAFEHNVVEIFKCSYCPYEDSLKKLIEKHIRNEHKDQIFNCKYCHFIALNYSNYKKHLFELHPDRVLYFMSSQCKNSLKKKNKMDPSNKNISNYIEAIPKTNSEEIENNQKKKMPYVNNYLFFNLNKLDEDQKKNIIDIQKQMFINFNQKNGNEVSLGKCLSNSNGGSCGKLKFKTDNKNCGENSSRDEVSTDSSREKFLIDSCHKIHSINSSQKEILCRENDFYWKEEETSNESKQKEISHNCNYERNYPDSNLEDMSLDSNQGHVYPDLTQNNIFNNSDREFNNVDSDGEEISNDSERNKMFNKFNQEMIISSREDSTQQISNNNEIFNNSCENENIYNSNCTSTVVDSNQEEIYSNTSHLNSSIESNQEQQFNINNSAIKNNSNKKQEGISYDASQKKTYLRGRSRKTNNLDFCEGGIYKNSKEGKHNDVSNKETNFVSSDENKNSIESNRERISRNLKNENNPVILNKDRIPGDLNNGNNYIDSNQERVLCNLKSGRNRKISSVNERKNFFVSNQKRISKKEETISKSNDKLKMSNKLLQKDPERRNGNKKNTSNFTKILTRSKTLNDNNTQKINRRNSNCKNTSLKKIENKVIKNDERIKAKESTINNIITKKSLRQRKVKDYSLLNK